MDLLLPIYIKYQIFENFALNVSYKFEKESLNPDTDYPITSPIITEKNIYVAAYKSIYGLKKQHNKAPKLLWRVQTTGTILCEPVISDGTVFCASTDGNLYVLK